MMPAEAFRFGAFKTFQVPLARVATLADLRFGKQFEAADVFAGADTGEAVEHGRYAEIDGADDLILARVAGAGRKQGTRARASAARSRRR
jgi:endonuclease G